MSWASRRRALIIFGFVAILAALAAVPVISWLRNPPTCEDGIRNQGETAPDRGGPCFLLDERALIPHSVQWTRSFPIREGLWSATAYIENPNGSASVAAAPYRLRFYDERNALVAEHEGVTYLMPGAITPLYEGPVDAGTRRIARTFFEFTAPLVWERGESTVREVVILDKKLEGAESAPRVTATVRNDGIADLSDLTVVAVVFDVAGNALASSQTVIQKLPANEEEQIVFTWPYPFGVSPARVDVLPSAPPRFARE